LLFEFTSGFFGLTTSFQMILHFIPSVFSITMLAGYRHHGLFFSALGHVDFD